ncbi:MAG: glycosyltransferase family 2 protein [Gemmatimonadales bacterium]|nr:glycosyltransferase family 2 protein [Gemmatimonadales bacterium]
MTTPGLTLSIIVPVHQGAHILPQSLGALAESDLPRDSWELIVVDDASTDGTAQVAAQYADTVMTLGRKPQGPSYARNRGVEAARGDVIVFIDADVCVHRETLGRFVKIFVENPGFSAVFGSYDAAPPAPGLVSQYRNLLHHWVHQQNGGDAETFWAGCGAVRREVFLEAGMYDEWHFSRPQIEDIELGHRLKALGHQISLEPNIQATHLKRWTLRNMIATDFRDRGVPWTRLLIQRGIVSKSQSLNLRLIERVNTVLVWLSAAFAVVALGAQDARWLVGAAILLLPVLWFNRHLYGFFRKHRGFWFALRAVPLHLTYYFLNGIAVGWGWLVHHAVGEPQPAVAVQAFSEVGLESWPPVPRKAPEPPLSTDRQTPTSPAE